jgi:ankyrin repeat protein
VYPLPDFVHLTSPPSLSKGEIKDSSGRTALFYAAINKDRRAVQLLAQSKVQGALEVAAALDFDDILTECLGSQTAAGLSVR